MSLEVAIHTFIFSMAVTMGFMFTLFMVFSFIGIVPKKLMVSLSIYLGFYMLHVYSSTHWPIWISFVLALISFGGFCYLVWLVVVKRLLKETRMENKRKLEM